MMQASFNFGKKYLEDCSFQYPVIVYPFRTDYPIVTSVYFATTILLSVGYGDFTPGDFFDMGIVSFFSLYGVLLSGYCVSEFSAVVTHWSR